ncbi:MAG TPA: hypothetical protein VIL19_00535, partial [Casimicrobiaceae bacterium]
IISIVALMIVPLLGVWGFHKVDAPHVAPAAIVAPAAQGTMAPSAPATSDTAPAASAPVAPDTSSPAAPASAKP